MLFAGLQVEREAFLSFAVGLLSHSFRSLQFVGVYRREGFGEERVEQVAAGGGGEAAI